MEIQDFSLFCGGLCPTLVSTFNEPTCGWMVFCVILCCSYHAFPCVCVSLSGSSSPLTLEFDPGEGSASGCLIPELFQKPQLEFKYAPDQSHLRD